MLEDVYLLVTEALKGAAIARYVAKTKKLKTKFARNFANRIDPDKRKLDARGKEYDWRVYMKASDMAEKIKALFAGGYVVHDSPYVLNEIYVDTVWTLAFKKYKNLYWGDPDTIRDVRKKKLEKAPLKKGNVTSSFRVQRDLLELWLVSLNMLDFAKRFKFDEFNKEVLRYHNDVSEVFHQVETTDINWTKLERVLTHDLRQSERIAVFETASEFQFYSYAADYFQRIFFSYDVRDIGVYLMLQYERSNSVVGHDKYSDTDLMEETLRASDEFVVLDVVPDEEQQYEHRGDDKGYVSRRTLQKPRTVFFFIHLCHGRFGLLPPMTVY